MAPRRFPSRGQHTLACLSASSAGFSGRRSGSFNGPASSQSSPSNYSRQPYENHRAQTFSKLQSSPMDAAPKSPQRNPTRLETRSSRACFINDAPFANERASQRPLSRKEIFSTPEFQFSSISLVVFARETRELYETRGRCFFFSHGEKNGCN